MNPLTLRVENVGRFAAATIDLPEGTAALIGPNGAGKSTLLNAVEVALFADGSRDLASLLGPAGDRLVVELVFEHDATVYRVRRSYRQSGARGTATLDLEVRLFANPEQWEPLSRETTAATQALICATLGMSRATFNASCFLGQGNAGAFPAASPADRKALLGEILDPSGLWPRLAARASADRKLAEAEVTVAQAKIAERQERLEALPGLNERLAMLQNEQDGAAWNLELEEETLGEAQNEQTLRDRAAQALAANAAQAERVRTLTVQHDHARENAARADTALADAIRARDSLAEAQSELDALAAQASFLTELEAKLEAQRAARAERDAALERRRHAEDTCVRLEADARRASAEHTAHVARLEQAEAKLSHLGQASDGDERCDRCAQILGAEARVAALGSLTAEVARLNDEVVEKAHASEQAETAWAGARGALSAIVIPTLEEGTFGLDLQAARTAAERRPLLTARVDTLTEQAAKVPDLAGDSLAALAVAEDAAEALAAAGKDATDEQTLQQAVTDARAALTARRSDLDAATADLTRTQQTIEQLQTVEREIAELVEATAAAHAQLDLLRVAERAYGRDGIPVLIVENVLPQIESEANRILDLMPTEKGE